MSGHGGVALSWYILLPLFDAKISNKTSRCYFNIKIRNADLISAENPIINISLTFYKMRIHISRTCRTSNHKDETVVRLSDLYNGKSLYMYLKSAGIAIKSKMVLWPSYLHNMNESLYLKSQGIPIRKIRIVRPSELIMIISTTGKMERVSW